MKGNWGNTQAKPQAKHVLTDTRTATNNYTWRKTMPLKTLEELVAEAKANVGHISPDELTETTESIILLDVRDEPDYDEEHLPEAVSLPRGYLELDIDEIAPDADTHIVTYCGGGTRATLSAHTLKNMGYENVSVLTGGFRGWKAEGLPTEASDE